MQALEDKNLALAQEVHLLQFQNKVLKAMCTIGKSLPCPVLPPSIQLVNMHLPLHLLRDICGLTPNLLSSGECDYRALCEEAGIETPNN